MVDSDTLRKSNFYTDVVTEAYSNGEGEAVSVSTIDKRVVPVSGWISCKCNIDESMGVKIISPEGVKRVKNIEELEDSTMAYYIDFRNAEILLTKDLIGKTIYYEYYGTGVDRLCVNRIYTDLDNYGNILMTLEDMTNKYVQILNYLEGIENLDTKLNELKISIKSSNISIDEIAESILIANTSKSDLDKTIMEANTYNSELSNTNETSSNLNSSLKNQNNNATTNISTLTDLNNNALDSINKLDGEDGLVIKSEEKITSLEEKILSANTHESNLNSKISSATEHENTLGNSNTGLIKQAIDKENSLRTSIDDSVTKKSNLDISINNANTNYNNLNKLNDTVTKTTTPTLTTKKNEAEVVLKDLQKAITDGDIDYIKNKVTRKQLTSSDSILSQNEGIYMGNPSDKPVDEANPVGDSFYFTVQVFNSKYKIITAIPYNNYRATYKIICNYGTWGNWYNSHLEVYKIGTVISNSDNVNPKNYLLGSDWEAFGTQTINDNTLYYWKRIN